MINYLLLRLPRIHVNAPVHVNASMPAINHAYNQGHCRLFITFSLVFYAGYNRRFSFSGEDIQKKHFPVK